MLRFSLVRTVRSRLMLAVRLMLCQICRSALFLPAFVGNLFINLLAPLLFNTHKF